MSSTSGPPADDEGFREWAVVRIPALRRRAYRLCGDAQAADDLVQETLARVYARWQRVADGPNPDAYATQVLVTRYLNERRRPWHRVRLFAVPPDRADPGAGRAFDAVDAGDGLVVRALASLPATQRVVLALRFGDDLSVQEVAALLRVSTGTVKSRTARGSERLRAELARLGHPLAVGPAEVHVVDTEVRP